MWLPSAQHSLAAALRWQPVLLVQVIGTRGINTDFVLKELWLCVLACLVGLRSITQELDVFHLPQSFHRIVTHLQQSVLKAFKGKFISHGHLDQSVIFETNNRSEAWELRHWGRRNIERKSFENLPHVLGYLEDHEND